MGDGTAAPRIIADSYELESTIPQLLHGRGLDVEIAALPAGDYVVGPRVLVERKSVLDLHGSVLAGRFWRQIGKLRASSRRGYLLIEGEDLDAGPLQPDAVRGICVVVLDLGVGIIRSTNAEDSARWLHRLAVRCQRAGRHSDRPRYDQARGAASRDVPEAVLAAVPGISVVCARNLLQRFGNVANVVAAGREEWIKVSGVGPTRAAALERAFASAAGQPQRNPGDPCDQPSPVSPCTPPPSLAILGRGRESPDRASAVETTSPGGTRAAGSGQADPWHLGGNP